MHWRDAFRYWRYLVGDSSYIFGQRILVTIVLQGDYVILGSLYGAVVVGPYFFAYGVATQAIRLTAGSLQLVLMAGLSRMEAFSVQQTRGALRATKAIALCGIPLCMLQAVLAGPLLRALYHDKWASAIPLVQLLSIGLAFDVVSWPAFSLMQSRGQFRWLFYWSCMTASMFVLLVLVGAYFGRAFGAALAVCVFFTVFAPPLAIWAFWSSNVKVWEIIEMYARPMLVGIISSGVALSTIYLTAQQLPLWQFAFAACTGSLTMLGSARLFAPDLWNDVFAKVTGAFPVLSLIRR